MNDRPGANIAARRELPAEWNRTTERVIACAIEVHRHLGPGILESLYEEALTIELRSGGLSVARQEPVAMHYKGVDIGQLRVDLIVERVVVVELKVVERVMDSHLAQMLSYMRALDLPLGLLLNFSQPRLVDGVFRRINDRCSRMNSLPLLVSPLRSSPRSETSEFETGQGGSP